MDRMTGYLMHKGKKILYTDYKSLEGRECADRVLRNKDEILTLGKGQLILVDVTGCIATSEIVDAFKDCATAIQPFVSRTAVIGLKPIQKVMLHAVNIVSKLKVRPFPSKEKALDWLSEG